MVAGLSMNGIDLATIRIQLLVWTKLWSKRELHVAWNLTAVTMSL